MSGTHQPGPPLMIFPNVCVFSFLHLHAPTDSPLRPCTIFAVFSLSSSLLALHRWRRRRCGPYAVRLAALVVISSRSGLTLLVARYNEDTVAARSRRACSCRVVLLPSFAASPEKPSQIAVHLCARRAFCPSTRFLSTSVVIMARRWIRTEGFLKA